MKVPKFAARLVLLVVAMATVVLGSAIGASAGGTGATTNLTYTPTRLSFGGIRVSDVSKKNVSFTNTNGGINLVLDSTGFSSGLYFVLGPDNGNAGSCAYYGYLLLGGSTCWVEVMFEPGPKGHFTDTLTTQWYELGACCTITDTTVTALSGSAH